MQQQRGIKQYANGFNLATAPNRMQDPYKWRNPKLVFVNSMSDLFHEEVPTRYLVDVFKVMNDLPRHTFQVLTKRIERALKISKELTWSQNIWLGVSVENNETSERIDLLKNVPAANRFVSFEPLLEDISYSNFDAIDWVIVGGESGGAARPIEKDWIINDADALLGKRIERFNLGWDFTN